MRIRGYLYSLASQIPSRTLLCGLRPLRQRPSSLSPRNTIIFLSLFPIATAGDYYSSHANAIR